MNSKHSHSLINTHGTQQDLIPPEEIPDNVLSAMEEGEDGKPGIFTGERIFKQDPDRYRWAVTLIPQLGINGTARALKMSSNTVMAIRDREGAAIETVKKEISRQIMNAQTMTVEAINEILHDPDQRGKVSLRDLAVTLGVLVDKGLLLEGLPNHIVGDATGSKADHEGFNAFMEELRRQQREKTGYAGETDQQTRQAPIDAEFTMDGEPQHSPGDGQSTDYKAVNNGAETEENQDS